MRLSIQAQSRTMLAAVVVLSWLINQQFSRRNAIMPAGRAGSSLLMPAMSKRTADDRRFDRHGRTLASAMGTPAIETAIQIAFEHNTVDKLGGNFVYRNVAIRGHQSHCLNRELKPCFDPVDMRCMKHDTHWHEVGLLFAALPVGQRLNPGC